MRKNIKYWDKKVQNYTLQLTCNMAIGELIITQFSGWIQFLQLSYSTPTKGKNKLNLIWKEFILGISSSVTFVPVLYVNEGSVKVQAHTLYLFLSCPQPEVGDLDREQLGSARGRLSPAHQPSGGRAQDLPPLRWATLSFLPTPSFSFLYRVL